MGIAGVGCRTTDAETTLRVSASPRESWGSCSRARASGALPFRPATDPSACRVFRTRMLTRGRPQDDVLRDSRRSYAIFRSEARRGQRDVGARPGGGELAAGVGVVPVLRAQRLDQAVER